MVMVNGQWSMLEGAERRLRRQPFQVMTTATRHCVNGEGDVSRFTLWLKRRADVLEVLPEQ
jgi:hypothetical protein